MKILVTGCLHSEFDLLLDEAEKIIASGTKLDLIMVNGDAETFRYKKDMESFAAPPRYHVLGTFYKLFNEERKAPCPIIIFGGNHEASDLLFQLPFGGYIAPNVFYAGRAGQYKFGDLTLTGISGIYNHGDKSIYYRGVTEKFPIRSKSDLSSCYNLRAFSDIQLCLLSKTDIFMSHDWPSSVPLMYERDRSIADAGSIKESLIESAKKNTFGYPMAMKHIEHLKPKTYFGAHHHTMCKLRINKDTYFEAYSKPFKYWYTVYDFDGEPGPLMYSGEWISALRVTSDLMLSPAGIESLNWDEAVETLRSLMDPCEDSEPVPYIKDDPVAETVAFCKKFGVSCPNPEIVVK